MIQMNPPIILKVPCHKKLSEIVLPNIPKGIVGDFELTVL